MTRTPEPGLLAILVMAAALGSGQPLEAQEPVDPMAATVAQWFTMIERSFVSLADAMPEEKYAFTPTGGAFDGSRSFGDQVKHVACGNFAFQRDREEDAARAVRAGGPNPARTKAELVTYLREWFPYTSGVLKTMTPANALEPAGGPYGGQSTRLGLATLAVWHASDHYGQLVIYLRMNGIVPPASRPAPAR